MEKKIITEEQVKEALDKILNEEISKVSREEFSRTQFKIEELENSLVETIKEFRKLENSIPDGLKHITNKKIYTISTYLIGAQGNISKLKSIIKSYKRKMYGQQIAPETIETPMEEKK